VDVDVFALQNCYEINYQKDLNLSFDQAEALKKGERVEGAAPENLHPILQVVSENIALEIQKTFDFFRATSSEDRMDRIFLSGGASKVQGLRDLLSERFEAGVELLNPFNSVTYNPRDFDPDFINDVAPSAAIAVGLAVRRMGDR
jgi:type IV pilus assembly protein PilM